MIILSREIDNPITGRKEQRIRTIDTHELAWAAGFFDGEGTTYYQLASEKHNPQLRMNLPQKDKRNLKRFNRSVLGICTPSNIPRPDGVSQLKTNSFENTQAVIALLWKYLSPAKKQQYRHAVEQYMKNWKGHLLRGNGAKNNFITSSPALSNAVNDEASIIKGIMTGG